jgi:type 1 fimbria pilin
VVQTRLFFSDRRYGDMDSKMLVNKTINYYFTFSSVSNDNNNDNTSVKINEWADVGSNVLKTKSQSFIEKKNPNLTFKKCITNVLIVLM